MVERKEEMQWEKGWRKQVLSAAKRNTLLEERRKKKSRMPVHAYALSWYLSAHSAQH